MGLAMIEKGKREITETDQRACVYVHVYVPGLALIKE